MKQEPTGAAPSAAGGIPALQGREDVKCTLPSAPARAGALRRGVCLGQEKTGPVA